MIEKIKKPASAAGHPDRHLYGDRHGGCGALSPEAFVDDVRDVIESDIGAFSLACSFGP